MLSLDPTTRAEYDLLYEAGARAQSVLDALANPVLVRVYDGSGQVMGQGTMGSPWATRTDGTLTIGEVTTFNVLVSGSPDPASWYLRFESGSRYLQGTFGVYGSAADFTWRKSSANEPQVWTAGQAGSLGAVDATAYDVPVVFGWTIPDEPYAVSGNFYSGTAGQMYNVAQHAADPQDVGVYTITAQAKNGTAGEYGFTVAEDTGIVFLPDDLPAPASPTIPDSYAVSVSLAPLVTATEITTLQVSGSGAWTFGQAFADDPAITPDAYVSASVPGGTCQVEIRNRWASGRPKFAVISGTAPGTVTIASSATDTMATASPVAVPTAGDLASVSVVFTGVVVNETVTVPVSASAQFGADPALHTSGRVRLIPGPVMTEAHYYAKTSDPHLRVWFYVRKYVTGKIEVETAIEQGWLKVASPVEKQYGVTVSVGGSTVYSGTVNHRHHARWSCTGYINGSQATPSHDATYLKSTGLLPNYSVSVSQSLIDGLVTTAAPMTRGPFALDANGGGNLPHLGPLPQWDACYLLTGQATAYRAMLAAEQASNCCNSGATVDSGSFVNRNELTGLVPDISTLGYNSYANFYSPENGSGYVYRGTNTSGYVWKTDAAHGWSAGYLAYLTTGRRFSLETCQFNPVAEYLGAGQRATNPYYRRITFGQDRQVGWMLLHLAQAATVTPDDEPNGFVTNLTDSLGYWYANELYSNTLGLRTNLEYQDPATVPWGIPAPYRAANAFMWNCVAFGFAESYNIASDLVSTTTAQQWLDSAKFHLGGTVGRVGDSTGFCYRHGVPLYGFAAGPTQSTFYGSWAEVWTDFPNFRSSAAAGDITLEWPPAPCADGVEWGGYYSGDNYPAFTQNALAHAVDFGVTGADAAWARFVNTNAYNTLRTNLASYPNNAVVPR